MTISQPHALPEHSPTATQAERAFDDADNAARYELAVCYRLFDFLGWTEMIFNHITLRIGGGTEAAYLINPFGLHYSEVTPENLVAVGLDGVARGPGRINRAGLIIHTAIHRARPDAHCIMHVHTTAGCAVACKVGGLRSDNFYSAMLHGAVAYHDYEGVTTRESEQERLVPALADKNWLILRNHGLLAIGATPAQAFHRLWTLQRACEIQLASDAGRGENVTIRPEVLEGVPASRLGVSADRNDVAQLMFDAMARKARIVF